jgi:hypothetical protein
MQKKSLIKTLQTNAAGITLTGWIGLLYPAKIKGPGGNRKERTS